MNCPKCQNKSRVIDLSKNQPDNETYRMRKCPKCGHVFYSVEYELERNEDFKKLWNKNYRRSEKKQCSTTEN